MMKLVNIADLKSAGCNGLDGSSPSPGTNTREIIMQASHILVDSLQKAEAILAEATPQSFSSLAKQHSSCPSKAQGGNLGTFSSGAMVKPFEEATLRTAIGAISKPVQTQFGFHLIHRTG
jgi:peptidyl-prolyl cis-trans isomerase C|tara:strand:+ start:151 stop:510 length:360 start_codon:yes stop_codon:yes gene_type:complete